MDAAKKSHHSQSYNYEPHDIEDKELRGPLKSAVEIIRSGKGTTQRLEVGRSAI